MGGAVEFDADLLLRGAELGVEMLNDALQALLNPDGRRITRQGRTLAVGDKVMQLKNNYEKQVYSGDIGKINPPLRERSDCDALWDGIVAGDIDTVATDHVHRDIASKAGGIWKASPGCVCRMTTLACLPRGR